MMPTTEPRNVKPMLQTLLRRDTEPYHLEGVWCYTFIDL